MDAFKPVRVTCDGDHQVVHLPADVTAPEAAVELRYGAERRGAPRLTQRVQDLLGLINVRALEAPADQI